MNIYDVKKKYRLSKDFFRYDDGQHVWFIVYFPNDTDLKKEGKSCLFVMRGFVEVEGRDTMGFQMNPEMYTCAMLYPPVPYGYKPLGAFDDEKEARFFVDHYKYIDNYEEDYA